MKIGFFTDEYLPRTDGVVTSMMNLKAGLEKLGHEVYIIAPAYPGYHDEPNGIIRLKSLNPVLFDNVRFMYWGPKTMRRLEDLKLDVIHAHTNFLASVLADRLSRRTGIPQIASIHTIWPELSSDYPSEFRLTIPLVPTIFRMAFKNKSSKKYNLPGIDGRRRRLRQKSWKYLARYTDMYQHVLVPSRHLAEKLTKLGVDTQLHIQPNSIELSVYRGKHRPYDGKKLHIVCVGRLSGEKRQNHLIDAVSKLKDEQIGFHLTLVGSGPTRSKLERQIDRLGLNREISFTGQLEPHDVKQLLAQSDIGILASHEFDNCPMVILEYAAAGLPILYCDPALTEALDESNALLTRPDAESLFRGLKELATSPERLRKMSEASLEIIKEYDTHRLSRRAEAVYRQAIDNH
ncbi:MAG: glycosyltransferase [Candidatus Saccharimonadales bacterium]|nr:glycosyltransferase [Candidatus Saccharimonadales bacterium]